MPLIAASIRSLGSDFLDILGADALEDVAEQVELFIDRCRFLGLLRHQRPGQLGCQQRPCHGAAKGRHHEFLHSVSSYPAVPANHSVGSTGSVPCLSSK